MWAIGFWLLFILQANAVQIKNYTFTGSYYTSTYGKSFTIFNNLLGFIDYDYICEEEPYLEFTTTGNFNKVRINTAWLGELSATPKQEYNFVESGYRQTLSIRVMNTFSWEELTSTKIFAISFFDNERLVDACFFTFNDLKEGNLTYTYNTQYNEARVTGWTGEGSEIVVPESVSLHGQTFLVKSIRRLTERGHNISAIGLTKATIPATVTTVEDGAFEWCNHLEEVVLADGEEKITINPIYDDESSTYLPAFRRTRLKKVYWGRPYTEFTNATQGEQPCSGKTTLEEVVIGPKVTKIPDYLFLNCTSLNSVSISEGVSEIGKETFSGCSALTSIDLPESITKIGYSAFYRCSNLENVYSYAPRRLTLGNGAFQAANVNRKLHVPASYINLYNGMSAEFSATDEFVQTNASGWATGCLSYDATVPADADAYYISGADGDCVVLTKIEGTIPAGQGFIFNAMQGRYLMPATTAPGTLVNNLLAGATEDLAVNVNENYVLGAIDNETVGFLTYTGTTIPRGRAYLPTANLPSVTAASRSLMMKFDDGGNTSGIEEIKSEVIPNQNITVYSLSGHPVDRMKKGSIYIVNGKKVLVK